MFLGTAIDDNVANVIQAQLLFLQSTDASRDIQMCMSPNVVSMPVLGFMIRCNLSVQMCNHMCRVTAPWCNANSWSRRAFAYSRKGNDTPAPGGAQGQASDIEILAVGA